VVARVFRAGWQVLVTELPNPLAVRRSVSFAQAVFSGSVCVEGICAEKVEHETEIAGVINGMKVAVIVDPDAQSRLVFKPDVLVDARMLKKNPDTEIESAALVIGLGPGFLAGNNCHAVVETKRGHKLGRVIWEGSADPDSGIPEAVGAYETERVLRAPCAGMLHPFKEIGDLVNAGDVIAMVNKVPVTARFAGILRGIVHDRVPMEIGMKIGDLDPRCDPDLCHLISDKALAIGGGVLEAILSSGALKEKLRE
jgi:xanthine dehydrogenase accessory factor